MSETPSAKKKYWITARIDEIDFEQKRVTITKAEWNYRDERWETAFDRYGNPETYEISYDEKIEKMLDEYFEKRSVVAMMVCDGKIMKVEEEEFV